jgi:hypothetical protein
MMFRCILMAAFALALIAAASAETFTGLTLSQPLLLSGNAGVRFGDPMGAGMKPVLEGEAGVGGGRLMLGLESFGQGFGGGIKASMLRTWLEPIGGLDTDQTYLGVELQGGYSQLILGLGGYRLIDGDDSDWTGTVSLGFRF